jgi:type I restriction enzyme S subunit
MNADQLLAHYERVAEAPDAIARLRRFILDLAVRGKLVPQDPNDEPASELLNRIAEQKARLLKAREIKKAEAVADLTDSIPDFPAPSGWAITNLHSICNSVTDGDHLPPPKAEAGIPFLVIGNVRSQRIEFEGSRFVPQSYYDALDPIRRPKSGDLLYTLVGSYGIPVIVCDDRAFCVQRHIGILRPSALVDVKFLARAMESRFAFDQATACATGIAQKTVPLSGLRRLLVPLPPLAEQRRIVAKVDELMALCDRLEAARAGREAVRDRLAAASLARLNAPDPETFQADARFALDALPALTTRPDQIKRLRQTILNLAVRGKLVPQDPKDEPASELLKRIAKEKARLVKAGEIRKEKTLPEVHLEDALFDLPLGWSWVRLGSATIIVQGFAFSSGDFATDPSVGLPLIKIGDIGGNAPEVFIKGTSDPAYLVKPGDILLGLSGSIKCSMWEGPEALLNQRIARIAPPPNELNSTWLLFGVNASIDKWKKETSKLTVQNIKAAQLNEAIIPLPPLAEQHRIVAKVDELMRLCDRLEASLDQTAATRRRLLDALLAEALAPADVLAA